MSRVLIILEGAADLPVAGLKGRTPLQTARLPVLTRLARSGRQGRLQPCPGCSVDGRDQYLWAMIGQDYQQWPYGFGACEGVGLGMPVRSEHWLLSAALVTLDQHRLDDPHGGGLGEEEAAALFQGLNELQDGWEYSWFSGNRAILKVPRADWPGALVQQLQSPPELLVGSNLLQSLPAGAGAVPLRDAWIRSGERLCVDDINLVRVDLGEAPANGIWWWGGPRQAELDQGAVPGFSARIKGGVISDSYAFCGLARLCGLDFRHVPGYMGRKSYYSERLAEVADLLGTHEVIVVHAERPLDCSLRGAVDEKVWALEGLDQLLLRPLLEMLEGLKDWRLMVTSGVAASVERRRLLDDPVPYLLVGSDVRADGSRGWNEQTSMTGAGGMLRGADIWKQLVYS